MKKVIVTSTNPVKLEAVRSGFEQMFPGESFSFVTMAVPSGVSDQPGNEAETRLGAVNRIRRARQLEPLADFWVGIEGGIERGENDLMAFAWVYIISTNISGRARTASFILPQRVAELIAQGKEMGEADDIVFNQFNSKQKIGAVGLLTGCVLDRTGLYIQGVILALIPFTNPDLYR